MTLITVVDKYGPDFLFEELRLLGRQRLWFVRETNVRHNKYRAEHEHEMFDRSGDDSQGPIPFITSLTYQRFCHSTAVKFHVLHIRSNTKMRTYIDGLRNRFILQKKPHSFIEKFNRRKSMALYMLRTLRFELKLRVGH